MKDRDFLVWLAARLVNIYSESSSCDFVRKLKAIARTLPPEQDTKWS